MATTLQAPESNQESVADDSSVKMIEFLRARLLSERAASKAARHHAWEIAEKVKDLNARLEIEIRSRKEAESAMGKIFTILRARGLVMDAPTSTDSKVELEKGISTLDNFKEMEKYLRKEVWPKPLQNKDESAEKGMIEEKKHGTREPHASNPSSIGIVSEEDQTLETPCNMPEEVCKALPSTDLKDEQHKGVSALDDVKEMTKHRHKEVLPQPLQKKDESAEKGQIEEKKRSTSELHASDLVRGIDIVSEVAQTLETPCNLPEEASPQGAAAVTDKLMVYTDNMSPKCPGSVEKDWHTAEAFDEGLSITLKMKAMLHQMEEEMAALPQEQEPLKLQLQSWVDHVAGVLHMEKESDLNADLDAGSNSPLKEAEEVNVAALNKIHDTPGGVDEIKEEMGKTLYVVSKDMVQQSNVMPLRSNYERPYPSTTCSQPTRKDYSLPSKVFHNRRSSYDAVHNLEQPPIMPMPPQMMPCGISQPRVAYATSFANSYTANNPPCYVEAQSPRSSDAFSLVDGPSLVGNKQRQLCESRSQGRGLGIERQAGYREDAMKYPSEMWSQAGSGFRDMLSSPYIVDVLDEVHVRQDHYLNTQNIQFQRAHSYSHRVHMDQANSAAEFNMARPPQSFPAVSDGTLSLTDDSRNGRLGDILMVLDAARQLVNEEEQSLCNEELLFGPPTPTVEEARLNRGNCPCGDDMQQMPFEHLNHARRSQTHSQAPIIQFPLSPASEHGCPPFERGHGRHRRSSSVSANFMMSGWDSYLLPRGEVQLGNGITLYTD